MNSELANLLDEYEDRAADIREVKYVGFENALRRFVHLLEKRPELAEVVGALPEVDFDSWYARALATSTGMAGSGKLDWPLDTAERLAMQLELIRRVSTRTIDLGTFTSTFMYTGSPLLDTRVAVFVSQVFEPLTRDLRRLVSATWEEQASSDQVVGETVLERRIRWFKDHPVWSRVLLVAIIVVAVGGLVGALKEILSLPEVLRPVGEERKSVTTPGGPAEEGQAQADPPPGPERNRYVVVSGGPSGRGHVLEVEFGVEHTPLASGFFAGVTFDEGQSWARQLFVFFSWRRASGCRSRKRLYSNEI